MEKRVSNMDDIKEAMLDLQLFLKSLYIGGGRTINSILPISDEKRKEYINLIEKILNNDVILVSKDKLEKSFKESLIKVDRDNAFVFEKNYTLTSQVRISPYEYGEYANTERFKKYLDDTLTNQLVSYFINNLGFTKYDI
jgi:hypothetical protein